jgi:hypothetical protein
MNGTEPTVIQKDILGHLGHIFSTHARKNGITSVKQKDLNKSVPTVPSVDTLKTGKNTITSTEKTPVTWRICDE